MKFSSKYAFFPDNAELTKAIQHFKRLSQGQSLDDTPDSSVTAPDNFLHTRGNYELRQFAAGVLAPARATLEAALAELDRQQSPSAWAEMQNSLGNILAALGQQQQDAALYQAAIAAFNAALEESTQADSPSEWATAQYNLGTALQALGRQQSDSKLLKSSVDAYTAALLVWTRDNEPEKWASAMFQLGVSFYEHGRLLKGNRTFQKSVVAFKNALTAYNADEHALALAATHNSRGIALHTLAESEQNTDRFQEAINAYSTALTVCMEQQLPIHLAVLCRVNRSTTRTVLAELSKDAVIAEEAADDFELIIECFPHALQPLCLTHCEEQMHNARKMVETFS